jgi:hypothetical protein
VLNSVDPIGLEGTPKQDQVDGGAAPGPEGGKQIEYDSNKIDEETRQAAENLKKYVGGTAEAVVKGGAVGISAFEMGIYNAGVDALKGISEMNRAMIPRGGAGGRQAHRNIDRLQTVLDTSKTTPQQGSELPYYAGYAYGSLLSGGELGSLQLKPPVMMVVQEQKALSPLWKPSPGNEVFVGKWLDVNMQLALDKTAAAFPKNYEKMAQLVPSSVPYKAVPQYGGYIVEYGLKLEVESTPILGDIVGHNPLSMQMRPGGAADFALKEPFAQWNVKPWDSTTALQAVRKMQAGKDYTFLTYTVNWAGLFH